MTSPSAALFPHFRQAWLLHVDDDLVVIDKPAFLATHAPEPNRVDDARSRLLAFFREAGETDPYLGVHQRLDKGTSGVLVFARHRRANPGLAEQFESRSVHKVYVAAVHVRGKLPSHGTLRHRVAPAEGGAMRVVPRGGQEAVTGYRVLARAGERALVELTPETGRTHQIRVQLAAVGAPVAGDRMYSGGPAQRLMLHAKELSLRHPITKREVSFVAPLPLGFESWTRGDDPPFDRLEGALRDACDARYGIAHEPGNTAFRLVHGAGDALPGVAVDLYGEHLVVSCGEELSPDLRDLVLDAVSALGARGVYLKVRPKHASVIVDARRDEFAPKRASRGEDAPEAFTIQESNAPFKVRLGDGLSTGLFLDQRENRRRFAALAKDARVLNLFAYTGAFSVVAALGGARSSVSVDASRGALAWARENLDAIGADPRAHDLVVADAFVWLSRARQKKELYDLIALDPPSFATTKSSTFSAAHDYRGLAELVMRVAAPGARLLASTNHRGMLRAKFRRYLHEAARAAGREVVQMKDLPDPVDFPPDPGVESHLKAVLVTLS